MGGFDVSVNGPPPQVMHRSRAKSNKICHLNFDYQIQRAYELTEPNFAAMHDNSDEQ